MTFARGVAAFFAAMIVQWWWTTYFSVFGLAPQLLVVLTILIAARGGPVRAMCLGFGWGLFLDLLNARLFGAHALALTWVGYATGSLRRQIDVSGIAPQCLVVLGMTWAYFLLLGFLGTLFMKQFLWIGWAQFLVDPVYNSLVGLLIGPLWRALEPARPR